MLRTTLQTAGTRGALQLSSAARAGMHTKSILPHMQNPRILAQRTFTTLRSSESKRSTNFIFSSYSPPQSILQRLRTSFRSFHTSHLRRSGTPNPAIEPEPQTLGARMKKLSREYGWSAVGVYFALSALDFPFCYFLVKTLGTDRIGRWEEVIVSNVAKVIPESIKIRWHEWRASVKKAAHDVPGGDEVNNGVEMAGWGVEEAERKNKAEASLATTLALAYAIHKSFIFARVPLAAAVTPKVVKTLRGWGWDIGKRTTKEAKAIKRAAIPVKPKKA